MILLDVSVGTVTGTYFWQARYGYPIWMGVPILLGADRLWLGRQNEGVRLPSRSSAGVARWASSSCR